MNFSEIIKLQFAIHCFVFNKGRGVLPIMAYTGRLCLKGVLFFTLQVYERVGISRVEAYERVGKSVI